MLNNFEYTFFDQQVTEKFSQFVKDKGFNVNIRQENSINETYSYEVSIVETLDDDSVAIFEHYYADLLFGEQAALVEGNGENGAIADACGVQVQLKNRDFTTIAIEPEIMNKILSVLTTTELQSFLAKVAEDIEEPKIGSICQLSSS